MRRDSENEGETAEKNAFPFIDNNLADKPESPVHQGEQIAWDQHSHGRAAAVISPNQNHHVCTARNSKVLTLRSVQLLGGKNGHTEDGGGY